MPRQRRSFARQLAEYAIAVHVPLNGGNPIAARRHAACQRQGLAFCNRVGTTSVCDRSGHNHGRPLNRVIGNRAASRCCSIVFTDGNGTIVGVGQERSHFLSVGVENQRIAAVVIVAVNGRDGGQMQAVACNRDPVVAGFAADLGRRACASPLDIDQIIARTSVHA